MIAKLLKWNGEEIFARYSIEREGNTIFFENDVARLFINGEHLEFEIEYINQDSAICDEMVLFINLYGFINIVYVPEQEVDIFVTNKCNSNCIMCPLSEGVRKQTVIGHNKWLWDYIDILPDNVGFINVTGGEPTLAGEFFFDTMELLKEKFQYTEFQMLTNGRTFSDKGIYDRVIEVSPRYMRFSIPVHSSTPAIHDRITKANGSFAQTDIGIKRLLHGGEKVEIRIVVSKYNIDTINETVKYLIDNYPGLWCVTFIGMEMMGNAALNKDLLWLDYEEVFEGIKCAIKELMIRGIDVLIYNLPLCAVEESFWSIAVKSITESKIRYMDDCNMCRVRSICGGFFSSTKEVIKPHVSPILE